MESNYPKYNFFEYKASNKDSSFTEITNKSIEYLKSKEKTELEKSVPVINVNSVNKEENKQKMIAAIEKSGFFYVEGLDIDQEELFYACKWFFDVSTEEKEKMYLKKFNKNNKNLYRGLMPLIKGDPSWKEIYDYGSDEASKLKTILYEENKVPYNDENFRLFMNKSYNEYIKAAKKIVEIISYSLDFDLKRLESCFDEKTTLSTLRLIHYPPRTDSYQSPDAKQNVLNEDGMMLTTPPHKDSIFLTILCTFGFYGLQGMINGEWVTIPPKKNTFVVNFGNCLEEMAKSKITATMHRVIDIETDRYSVPFFFDPPFDFEMFEDLLDNKSDKRTEKYGRYLINRMKREYVEWKDVEL